MKDSFKRNLLPLAFTWGSLCLMNKLGRNLYSKNFFCPNLAVIETFDYIFMSMRGFKASAWRILRFTFFLSVKCTANPYTVFQLNIYVRKACLTEPKIVKNKAFMVSCIKLKPMKGETFYLFTRSRLGSSGDVIFIFFLSPSFFFLSG